MLLLQYNITQPSQTRVHSEIMTKQKVRMKYATKRKSVLKDQRILMACWVSVRRSSPVSTLSLTVIGCEEGRPQLHLIQQTGAGLHSPSNR